MVNGVLSALHLTLQTHVVVVTVLSVEGLQVGTLRHFDRVVLVFGIEAFLKDGSVFASRALDNHVS